MLVKYILDRLYSASLPKRDSLINSDPTIKSVSLILVIVSCIVFKNIFFFIPLLLFPLSTVILKRDVGLFIESIKAPLPIASIIILISLIFVPWNTYGFTYLAILFLRIIIIASSMLIFISTTNPFHVAYILEKLRLPKWLVLSTILTWRLIPLTLNVSSESYAVTRLKGDKLWRSLVASSATSLLRAVNLMEALYIYGAGLKDFTLKPLVHASDKKASIYYGTVAVIVVMLLVMYLNKEFYVLVSSSLSSFCF